MKENIIRFLFICGIIVMFFVALERDKKRTEINKRIDTMQNMPDGTHVNHGKQRMQTSDMFGRPLSQGEKAKAEILPEKK